ncbi:MAG: peroxiredoxin family protein [Acidimicrobiia bacterium]
MSRTLQKRAAASSKATPTRRPLLIGVGITVGFVAILAAIFAANSGGPPASEGSGSGYRFDVGSPGPGEQAPPLRLPAADGNTFDLADLSGQTVLLYFQEGLMCPPCWDQLRDIEAEGDRFTALGIDSIVTITTDNVDLLARRVADEGLRSPVLSDLGREVSEAWGTLGAGMMGGATNGHSFVVVGHDGNIRWRADYGGAPDFTMYLPVSALLADLRQGLDAAG